MVDVQIPRPFLKWAGGKTQLLDALHDRVPSTFRGYFEPFVGSGAFFFKLVRGGLIRDAVLSDSNAELIDTFLAIRDDVGAVVAFLAGSPYDREFYYDLRSQSPWQLSLPARAARMIYLNKTGYNGLYRVNRQGKFNVPYGRHKSPRICDEPNLRAVSKALQGVEISCTPFEGVLEQAQAGDLVYFDPPYAPLSSTAYFTAYQSGGFSADDQRRLRDVCLELTNRHVHVMLSNSDTEMIRALYDAPPFAIAEVQANRAINCVGGRRGKITELIMTNYLRGNTPALF
jgi:DNA adenine methylase